MIDKDLLINRLSRIKLLFHIGVELSRQSELTSCFAILTFHDCIEMFLALSMEQRSHSFLQYWDQIPELRLKETMINLNNRRINLKHKGLIPAKIEVETSRVNSTDFFIQNTPIIFRMEFDEISLFDLIKFEKCKSHLRKSQDALNHLKFEQCVEEVTTAFYALMDEYKSSKIGWGPKTHFDFTEEIWIDNAIEDNLKDVVRAVNSNLNEVNTALQVMALGLDYRKYVKFKILTPSATKVPGSNKYVMQIYGDRNWTKENGQFLIDFVLDSAVKLQEFDFNIQDLDVTRAIIYNMNL
jgi:hypothetical protein